MFITEVKVKGGVVLDCIVSNVFVLIYMYSTVVWLNIRNTSEYDAV